MTADLPAVASGPVRIQLSREKGFRLPPNTVKVDRSTRWGNPFKATLFNPRDSARQMDLRQRYPVHMFRHMLTHDGYWVMPSTQKFACVRTTVEDVKRMLAGKNLACWCQLGNPCHADVLLEIANGLPPPVYLVREEKPSPALDAALEKLKSRC